MDWLLVLGLEEGLVECATLYVKSWVKLNLIIYIFDWNKWFLHMEKTAGNKHKVEYIMVLQWHYLKYKSLPCKSIAIRISFLKRWNGNIWQYDGVYNHLLLYYVGGGKTIKKRVVPSLLKWYWKNLADRKWLGYWLNWCIKASIFFKWDHL